MLELCLQIIRENVNNNTETILAGTIKKLGNYDFTSDVIYLLLIDENNGLEKKEIIIISNDYLILPFDRRIISLLKKISVIACPFMLQATLLEYLGIEYTSIEERFFKLCEKQIVLISY